MLIARSNLKSSLLFWNLKSILSWFWTVVRQSLKALKKGNQSTEKEVYWFLKWENYRWQSRNAKWRFTFMAIIAPLTAGVHVKTQFSVTFNFLTFNALKLHEIIAYVFIHSKVCWNWIEPFKTFHKSSELCLKSWKFQQTFKWLKNVFLKLFSKRKLLKEKCSYFSKHHKKSRSFSSHAQFTVNKCEDINHKVYAGLLVSFIKRDTNRTRRGITLKNCECNLSHGSSTKNENHNWEFMKKLLLEKCVTSLSNNLFMTAHTSENVSFLRAHGWDLNDWICENFRRIFLLSSDKKHGVCTRKSSLEVKRKKRKKKKQRQILYHLWYNITAHNVLPQTQKREEC